MSDERKLTVLVLWADTRAANFGLRVLSHGNARLIKDAFSSDATVDFQDFGPGDSDTSFGTKSIIRNIFRRSGPITEKIRKYDLIVDTGAGDSFADIYGLKRLFFIAYAHQVIKKNNVPLVLAPQTIGPFNTKIGRFFARRSLKIARLVTVRDTASAEYVQTLGRSADATATDVVFALPSEHVARAKTYDILFNVSGLLWFSDDHGNSSRYRTETIEAITRLTKSGRRVDLLPHVIASKSGNDDVDASKELTELLTDSGVNGVDTLIASDLTEMRSFMSAAEVVIGARMHACLNALSVGTPAIPWAYSRKFAPLLGDLGWKYVIDLSTSTAPAAETVSMIDSLTANPEADLIDSIRAKAVSSLGDYSRRLSAVVNWTTNVSK
ncbi:polysaccharide pyruvyl transferase family protein [Rhodococcus globerulus]|uniref:polysaccharide pyruvyl transferase family protein n=1 Tax=Rhodococcus globerulus TaxID=33008 RepID=UPI003018E9A8